MKNEKLESFLLNFLAVVLGIVITFGGDSLISRRQEKNSLNGCLELVALELSENLKLIDLGDSLVLAEKDAAEFLIKYEKDYRKADRDSLARYANTPFVDAEISVYTDAFELLKSSGVLTKFDDKELALDIFRAYGSLQDIMTFYKMFYDRKKVYIDEAKSARVVRILSSDRVLADELWSAITSDEEGRQFLREISRFLSQYDSGEAREFVQTTIDRIREQNR